MRCKFFVCSALVAGVMLNMAPSKAQSGFFYGLSASSANIWTAVGLSAVETVISLIPHVSTQSKYVYTIYPFKDGSEKMGVDYGRIYGFKGDELLNDIRVGAKVGWMGAYSPIGVYVCADYCHERFKTCFAYQTDYLSHRINTVKPGIGIRFSPLALFVADWDVYPIVEIGAMYNCHFKYKGGYEDDISQLNNGMSTLYSIGADLGGDLSILIGCEIPHFDLFNKEYTPDGGYNFPYANVKSKVYNVYLQFNIGF